MTLGKSISDLQETRPYILRALNSFCRLIAAEASSALQDFMVGRTNIFTVLCMFFLT